MLSGRLCTAYKAGKSQCATGLPASKHNKANKLMKTRFHIIMLCLAVFTFNTGCEKAELQKTISTEEVLITPRTDCQYCPDMHCCCSIEVLTQFDMTFEFCGTSGSKESITTCGPISDVGCSGDIEGYTWVV